MLSVEWCLVVNCGFFLAVGLQLLSPFAPSVPPVCSQNAAEEGVQLVLFVGRRVLVFKCGRRCSWVVAAKCGKDKLWVEGGL